MTRIRLNVIPGGIVAYVPVNHIGRYTGGSSQVLAAETIGTQVEIPDQDIIIETGEKAPGQLVYTATGRIFACTQPSDSRFELIVSAPLITAGEGLAMSPEKEISADFGLLEALANKKTMITATPAADDYPTVTAVKNYVADQIAGLSSGFFVPQPDYFGINFDGVVNPGGAVPALGDYAVLSISGGAMTVSKYSNGASDGGDHSIADGEFVYVIHRGEQFTLDEYPGVTFDGPIDAGEPVPALGTYAVISGSPGAYLLNKYVDGASDNSDISITDERRNYILAAGTSYTAEYLLGELWETLGVSLANYYTKTEIDEAITYAIGHHNHGTIGSNGAITETGTSYTTILGINGIDQPVKINAYNALTATLNLIPEE